MTEIAPPARLTVDRIKAMSPVAQAETWARLEDELLIDLDMGIGNGLSETDELRIAAAARLARAGVVFAVLRVVLSRNGSHAQVTVTRVFPIRKAA